MTRLVYVYSVLLGGFYRLYRIAGMFFCSRIARVSRSKARYTMSMIAFAVGHSKAVVLVQFFLHYFDLILKQVAGVCVKFVLYACSLPLLCV